MYSRVEWTDESQTAMRLVVEANETITVEQLDQDIADADAKVKALAVPTKAETLAAVRARLDEPGSLETLQDDIQNLFEDTLRLRRIRQRLVGRRDKAQRKRDRLVGNAEAARL